MFPLYVPHSGFNLPFDVVWYFLKHLDFWAQSRPSLKDRRLHKSAERNGAAMQADRSRNLTSGSQVLQIADSLDGQHNSKDQAAPETTVSPPRPARQSIAGHEEHPDHIHGQTDKDELSEEIPSDWSEAQIVPKRNLGLLQTISLVINLVIGSGIFISPGYVLALTRSKAICLVLWAAGGVYTGIWYDAGIHYPASDD